MLRWIALASAFLALTACETTGTDPNQVYLLIRSEPSAATLTTDHGASCETPCRIGVLDTVEITVGRTGFKADRRTLTRSTEGPVFIELEPVIAEQQVLEEVILPDL